MLGVHGYTPLTLRQALNKIAHSDPKTADYSVGPSDIKHELLLFGTERGTKWFAIVSVLDPIQAIRTLPDTAVVN